MSRLALIVLAACALAGCSSTRQTPPPVIVAAVPLPAVSDAELTCAPEPSVPLPIAGDDRQRESQVMGYILDLRTAGQDCRSKLTVARTTWRAAEKAQVQASKAIPPESR